LPLKRQPLARNNEHMIDLDDPRWATLTGGYKRPYDPRPALAVIRAHPDASEPWKELWQELHHQGDLGEASYAAVPVLVEIFRKVPRHWQVYQLLAVIALESRRRSNPPIPDWIAPSYQQAWEDIRQYALADLATSDDQFLIWSALAVSAFAAGQMKLGALLTYMDESETDELLEDRLAWSKLYVAG
jgi:hypothetical protein